MSERTQQSGALVTRAAAYIAKYAMHGETQKVHLAPDSVIVDPINRDGVFPSCEDVHALGASILPPVGFSITHTRGICCPLPADKDEAKKIVDYNIEKCSNDEGFPEVATTTIAAILPPPPPQPP